MVPLVVSGDLTNGGTLAVSGPLIVGGGKGGIGVEEGNIL